MKIPSTRVRGCVAMILVPEADVKNSGNPRRAETRMKTGKGLAPLPEPNDKARCSESSPESDDKGCLPERRDSSPCEWIIQRCILRRTLLRHPRTHRSGWFLRFEIEEESIDCQIEINQAQSSNCNSILYSMCLVRSLIISLCL